MKIGPSTTITLPDLPPFGNNIVPIALSAAGSGNVLTVGPGQQYATIAAAVAAAQPGDTINVQAGTYTNDFVTITNNLTLQAVGGVVHMVATVAPPDGKAIIDEGGAGISVTINGFDISGAAVSSGDGAAVRYEGGALTLNNDYFHNNQDGMLAASDLAGSITINHSEFAFNGTGDGQTHNLYVNDIANLTITDSYFHDANVGHEIKSRAENTTITGTRIFDNNSTASYSIDLPNGGSASIQNDVIEQGANSQNPIIISYGEEGSLHAGTSVLISGNTIVNDDASHSSTAVVNDGTATLTFQNNQIYGLTSTQIAIGSVAVSGTTYLTTRPTLDTSPVQTVCFARGTRILTARGEVPVEALVEGEPILTHTGEQRPLQWLGHRRLDVRRHRQPNLVAPVRILRDAFGAGRPHRDLVVSPDHSLFIDDKLIPAKLLINDMTILQGRDTLAVTYYHLELDRHAIVLAEGLPAESYLDTGNRSFFANAGTTLSLHPECQVNAGLHRWKTDACAPLTVDRAAVEPVWHRLAQRAATLGHQPPCRTITHDPRLRILADGRTIKPLAREDQRHLFALPPGCTSLRLISRAMVPSYLLACINEWRHLGVAVRRIVLRSERGIVEMPPDHPGLTEGWYGVERDAASMWRWMNGDALVLLPAMDTRAIVEIHLALSVAYGVERAGMPARLAA